MSAGKEEWRAAIDADFLESSAAAFAAPFLAAGLPDAPSGDQAGTLVGRFRLLEEIGRGGMGTVWLAERADGQFEQRVALKLIKRGMDSDEILARFLRERQILARLEHRNIARLLDGGVSDDGRPYFVMELVEGVPMTRYCDTHQLGISERLEIFAAVCRAVQCAHQSLIIHRDIKPSNVLVTGSGEAKLLDFGVAKLLGQAGTEEATMARGLMTPEYASPEQIAGGAVTTSSDIYQLGILLYELLAGRRPYDDASTDSRKHDPPHPSTAVGRIARRVLRDGTQELIEPALIGARRRSTPERLRKALRGDLDAITLRALRHDSAGRFPSAEALAEDVERHLAHLPIRSGAAGWSYRTTKFVRRNRVRVAAGVALLVASVIVGSVYVAQVRAERDRALREAAKASESAALLHRFFQGWSPDAADRGKVSADNVLADAAQRAERELGNNPEMLAATLSILGDLYAALGKTTSADTLLARALAIQDAPDRPSADLAATLARRGRLHAIQARYTDAEVDLRRSLAIYRSVLPQERIEVRKVQFDLAHAIVWQEKLAEAEALLRDALRNSPGGEAPFTTEIASDLGYVLFRQARYAEAVALLRTTLAQQRRMFGRLHQSTLRTMRSLASALRDRRDLPEAEELDRGALEIARTLYGADHSETTYTTYALAILLERKGDFVGAEQMTRDALAATERNMGESNVDVALERRTLGGARLIRGDLDEAELQLRRSLAGFRAASPGNPDEGDVRNRLAYVAFVRGAPDSMEVYRDAVAFELARRPGDPYFTTDGYEYLGWAARRRGDITLAERLYRRAVALYDGELPDGHPYRAQSVVGLGQTLLDVGKLAEAGRYLRAGLAQWQAARPPQPERVAEVRALLASTLPRRPPRT